MFGDIEGRERRIDRAKIKRAFRLAGMAEREAEEVVDLAVHAATGAMDLIFETAERASTDSDRLNVLSIAITIAQAELTLLRDCHTRATRTCGVELRDISVTTKGQAHG